MKVIIEEKIPVYLSPYEAGVFVKFQEHFTLIAHVVGVMDSLGLKDLNNANILMEFNNEGLIKHTAITKHYRDARSPNLTS